MCNRFTSCQVARSLEFQVQLSAFDFSDFSYEGSFYSPKFGSCEISSDGDYIRYGEPGMRRSLGCWLANGEHEAPAESNLLVKSYYHALADLKVAIEVAIAMSARIVEVISKRHLILVSTGPYLSLSPRTRKAPKPNDPDIEAAIFMATIRDKAVLNQSSGSDTARMILAYSGFKSDYLDMVEPHQLGIEPLSSLYLSIVSQSNKAMAALSGRYKSDPFATSENGISELTRRESIVF